MDPGNGLCCVYEKIEMRLWWFDKVGKFIINELNNMQCNDYILN